MNWEKFASITAGLVLIATYFFFGIALTAILAAGGFILWHNRSSIKAKMEELWANRKNAWEEVKGFLGDWLIIISRITISLILCWFAYKATQAIETMTFKEVQTWILQKVPVRTSIARISQGGTLLLAYGLIGPYIPFAGWPVGALKGYPFMAALVGYFCYWVYNFGSGMILKLVGSEFNAPLTYLWAAGFITGTIALVQEIAMRSKVTIPTAYMGTLMIMGTRASRVVLEEGDYYLPPLVRTESFNAKTMNVDLGQKEFAASDGIDVVVRFSVNLKMDDAYQRAAVDDQTIEQAVRKELVEEVNKKVKVLSADVAIATIAEWMAKDVDLKSAVQNEIGRWGMKVGSIQCQDADYKRKDIKEALAAEKIEKIQLLAQKTQREGWIEGIKKLVEEGKLDPNVAANVMLIGDGRTAPSTVFQLSGLEKLDFKDLENLSLSIGGHGFGANTNHQRKNKPPRGGARNGNPRGGGN